MSLSSFLGLVEIRTKVASIIPFLLGTFYALYRFNTFHVENFLLMLVSLLCIDMATTGINNYQDLKRAKKKHGYGYEIHNAIVSYNLKEVTVLAIILTLLAVAALVGILLFLNTNSTVLILGVISFMIGILYSFGPIPISRTPFGEIFSGIFLGFIAPFIAVYIHIFDQGIVDIMLQGSIVNIEINMLEVLYIALISMPTVIGIANIMLANNICDIEDDIENKRYTLPIYIGKNNALKIFRALYYLGYVVLMILVILGVAPFVTIITFSTFPFVNKNIKIFHEKQTKKDTFIVGIKNFVVVNVILVLSMALASVLKYIV